MEKTVIGFLYSGNTFGKDEKIFMKLTLIYGRDFTARFTGLGGAMTGFGNLTSGAGNGGGRAFTTPAT